LLKRSKALWLVLAVATATLAWAASASADAGLASGPPNVFVGAGTQLTPSIGPGSPTCTLSSGNTYTCYGPAYLQQAYDYPSQQGRRGLTGAGQTIIIVDAYAAQDATLQSDLSTFDAAFGIPDPPSFTVVQGPSSPQSSGGSGDAVGWSLETSLDVEYAHAMAPGANIVVASSASDDNFDINAAEAYVFPRYPGAIISQSFGDWETDSGMPAAIQQEHQIFEYATAIGDTILASSGDWGATFSEFFCDPGSTDYGTCAAGLPAVASYPASDPLVTSVGGTEGLPYPDGLWLSPGGYGGEQVWNEGLDSSGGAPSTVFAAPSYQRGVTGNRMRTTPDVAYNAAGNGGVLVLDTLAGGTYLVGGTSAGSPQWAGIVALLDQARGMEGRRPIGFMNDAVYQLGRQGNGRADATHRFGRDRHGQGAFHDITVGTNANPASAVGYQAMPGYDLATGWGSPDVSRLIGDLVNAPSGEHFQAPGPGRFGHGRNPVGPWGSRHRPHTSGPGA
jgi:subtilase family serine protease